MDNFDKRLQALLSNPNLPPEQLQAVYDLIRERDEARSELEKKTSGIGSLTYRVGPDTSGTVKVPKR